MFCNFIVITPHHLLLTDCKIAGILPLLKENNHFLDAEYSSQTQVLRATNCMYLARAGLRFDMCWTGHM